MQASKKFRSKETRKARKQNIYKERLYDNRKSVLDPRAMRLSCVTFPEKNSSN